MDSPTMYLGLLSDLASRGYIVFAPYHEDGTCSYTQTADGTDVMFDGGEEENSENAAGDFSKLYKRGAQEVIDCIEAI